MNTNELSAELFASQRRLQTWSEGTFLAGTIARLVGRVGSRLSRPPRIVLLGEFNSGKSTLANVLLGAGVLPTSIHSNTRVPILLRWADEPQLEVECAGHGRKPVSIEAIHDVTRGNARLLHLGLPLPQLKTFELIDTPGFADGMLSVHDLCLEACRRSNIAVWCTTAAQAWKATEVRTWSAIPQRLRRKSLLVVTHKDVLNSTRDEQRLKARLEMEVQPHFRKVVLLSSLEAQQAGASALAASAEAWRHAGGAALSQAARELVDEEVAQRVGAAERLLARAAGRVHTPAAAHAPAPDLARQLQPVSN